jgi:hypothetical protein
MSTLFLPLRSNCSWFASEEAHNLLVRRMKNWVLFYDQIAPENGRYRATYGHRGSFDTMMRGGSYEERRTISYHTPGREFSIRIGNEADGEFHPMLGGETVASYEVDFYPLLLEAGIISAEYIRWVEYELTPEAKREANRSADHVLRSSDFSTSLSENQWLRTKIVQNLYQDAVLAAGLNLPLSVDAYSTVVLEQGNAAVMAELSHEAVSLVQRSWVSLGLPDPGDASWDVVLRARESDAGRDLREMISRVSSFAAATLLQGGGAEDAVSEANRLLVAELVGELLQRRASTANAVINLGLNLIPYAGAVLGSANDARKLVQEHRSWVALLDRINPS